MKDWAKAEEIVDPVGTNMTTIKLPIFDIEITLSGTDGGILSSSLHDDKVEGEDMEYHAAIDGIESLILSCACAGIDVSTPAFLEAIETAVDAATNALT